MYMLEESRGNLAKPTREHARLFSSSLAPTKGRGVFTYPHGSVKTPSLICYDAKGTFLRAWLSIIEAMLEQPSLMLRLDAGSMGDGGARGGRSTGTRAPRTAWPQSAL